MYLEELGAGAGIVLIAAVIVEVFRDLFHPAHGGALSDWVGRRLFSLFKRVGWLPVAGPASVVTVIGSWIVLLALGFALVYNPAFPEDFRTSTGTLPPPRPDFAGALYFSFATLITLGYGDIVPASMTMRLIAVAEAVVGFGLLTASVSSLVLVYPALSRMRLLARTVAHLVKSEARTGMPLMAASEACLSGLARDVTSVRIDLVHFPITYYFATYEREGSLAYWLPDLVRLARDGSSPGAPDGTRLAAGALDDALTDLAGLLAERFLRMEGADREAVFRAWSQASAVDMARPHPDVT